MPVNLAAMPIRDHPPHATSKQEDPAARTGNFRDDEHHHHHTGKKQKKIDLPCSTMLFRSEIFFKHLLRPPTPEWL